VHVQLSLQLRLPKRAFQKADELPNQNTRSIVGVPSGVKSEHEVRDPVHVFARYDDDEQRVIDSPPVQRLRHIHQLAMTYLVYPGATHKRFEHSIGVMELAGRVFDVLTDQSNVSNEARESIPQLADAEKEKLPWWRHIVRIAALCHDVGHPPFSHAAEKSGLLPTDKSHEDITAEVLQSPVLSELLTSFEPAIPPEKVAKIAVGQKHAQDVEFSTWETLLSEIITGDAFGVDRMDYLLRDSLHTGVAYGRFDHFRLIDTLRIVVRTDPATGEFLAPEIGVQEGGLQSAASLLLARFFMFSQVYFHKTRVAYDLHLIDFLKKWLEPEGGRFPSDIGSYLEFTDNRVLEAIASKRNEDGDLGVLAKRLSDRKHFRVLYKLHPADRAITIDANTAIYREAQEEFGEASVKDWSNINKAGAHVSFPVVMWDGSIVDSLDVSDVLANVPVVKEEYVFIEEDKRERGRRWLTDNKDRILSASAEALGGGITSEALTKVPGGKEGGAA
jgi:HD superfamily phosphohydrolase